MSLVDRALKAVGLQRRPVKATAWAASRQNRLVLDWVWQHLSADRELQGELAVLRGRSRQVVKNDAFAKRYVRLQVKNVIGPQGIRLQARVMRGTLPNAELNKEIEAAWALWGRRENASTDRRLSWLGIQRIAMKSVATDGEFFARMVRGFDNPFGFALQLLDPDQLDTTFNRLPGPDGTEIRMGVEVNAWGEPLAYHFWRRHPADLGNWRERIRIPAADIIHLYDPDRVNQTRGVPPLAPVLLETHILSGYYEAELVAARVAAAKMGFFVNKNADATATVADPQPQGSLTMDAEPALMEQLPSGWEFQGWSPEHPTAAFPDFSKAILHKMASGLDVSYAGLTNDLSNTSYSSSRVGLLDERDSYRESQTWVVEGLHARVYAAWVPLAQVAGQLPVGVRPAEYQAVKWVARGWAWVDPEKDITASLLEIGNGLNSRTRVLAEQGLDFEEVLDDLVEEKKLSDSKGIEFEGSPAPRDKTQGKPEPQQAVASRGEAGDVHIHNHQPGVHVDSHTHVQQPAVHVAGAEVHPVFELVNQQPPAARRRFSLRRIEGGLEGEIDDQPVELTNGHK